MTNTGKQFEKAVYAFVSALDPSAEVIFNHHVPDRDTESPRQCDAWINATFAKHIPYSILVSCKDHAENITIDDMDTFISEISSRRANIGVLYTRKGFTENAILKAKKHGISCCKLYEDDPVDIPNPLLFDQYVVHLVTMLTLSTDDGDCGFEVWNDVFNTTLLPKETIVLDQVAITFHHDLEKKLSELKAGSYPKDWTSDILFTLINTKKEVRLSVGGHWRLFRARREATLLNGSYNLTNESFIGEIKGPTVEVSDAHPGEGWEEITDTDFIPPYTFVLPIPDRNIEWIKGQLMKDLGPKRLWNQQGEVTG